MPDLPLLRRGCRDDGDDYVASVQQALNEENGCNLVLDGIFGPATEREVLNFQRASGLYDDGYVGHVTWAALGWPADEPEDEPEIADWQQGYRQLLMRYQMLMWAGAPVLAVVPIWVSNRDHPITGAGWIGPAIVAAVFIPIWLMFGRLFLAFRTIFADQDEAEDLARRARTAERKLAIRRAERLERAEIRLARITQDRQAAEARRLALDVDRIRRELDVDDDGEPDPLT